jgi:hypothetical protein
MGRDHRDYWVWFLGFGGFGHCDIHNWRDNPYCATLFGAIQVFWRENPQDICLVLFPK